MPNAMQKFGTNPELDRLNDVGRTRAGAPAAPHFAVSAKVVSFAGQHVRGQPLRARLADC